MRRCSEIWMKRKVQMDNKKRNVQVESDGSRSAPVAVISGRDAASIGALERGLPHYGAQSWLVFEGGRAISRGTWPASLPAVPVVRR